MCLPGARLVEHYRHRSKDHGGLWSASFACIDPLRFLSSDVIILHSRAPCGSAVFQSTSHGISLLYDRDDHLVGGQPLLEAICRLSLMLILLMYCHSVITYIWHSVTFLTCLSLSSVFRASRHCPVLVSCSQSQVYILVLSQHTLDDILLTPHYLLEHSTSYPSPYLRGNSPPTNDGRMKGMACVKQFYFRFQMS